jgi:hypothetical protein
MSPRNRKRLAFRKRSKYRKPGDAHTILSFCESNNNEKALDVGPTNTNEAERLQVRVKKLQAQVRQRDITIEELRRDIAELQKTNENAALRAKLEAAQEVATAASSEIATANTVIAGDPGPMPDCLLRKPKEMAP